jgi:hypothetical protein
MKIEMEMAKLLKDEFNVDPSLTALLFDKGVFSIKSCRDVLIKEEYRRKAQPKERQRVKAIIADHYCISIKAVEKILSKNY